MDIRDFQGLTKFKIIVPAVYICSWLCMILGPVFFDVVYQRICIFVLIYTDVKVLILLSIMIIVTIRSNKVFKRIQQDLPPGEGSNRDELDPT